MHSPIINKKVLRSNNLQESSTPVFELRGTTQQMQNIAVNDQKLTRISSSTRRDESHKLGLEPLNTNSAANSANFLPQAQTKKPAQEQDLFQHAIFLSQGIIPLHSSPENHTAYLSSYRHFHA